MLHQHAGNPAALQGKTVGEMIVEEHAYAMALRMTAQAYAADRAHRAQMNALITASAGVAQSGNAALTIALDVRNKTGRTITSLDCGIEVHDAAGTRLGVAEFEVSHAIGPRAPARIPVVMPYAKFGGDARAVRGARGKHLTIALDVKEIGYSAGGSAGAGD
jgi:hypothetical protein